MSRVTLVAGLHGRVSRATPATLDLAASAVLTTGALVDVALLHRWVEVGAVLAVICTGSVAWRRRAPAAAAFAAMSSLLAYGLLTGDPQLTFEPFAIALVFYMLGRHAPRSRERAVAGVLLAYALAALALMFWRSGGNVPAQAAGGFLVFALVPWALGKLVARHEALGTALFETNARLRDGQDLRAAQAANEERHRMARELHDVIAHCVSVMVIQASAARIVLGEDLDGARTALRAVESSGREALADLRRIVGTRRRDGYELTDGPLRLSQLGTLAERAREVGVPTRVRISSPLPALPAGLELALFRVVQEALTNVVKHANGAAADIELGVVDGDAVEVVVTDSGAAAPGTELPESGHGLVGMRERVALHGGRLTAGPLPGGGWAVRASLPLTEKGPMPVSDSDGEAVEATPPRVGLGRTLDPALAAAWLVVLETEALTSSHRHGSLALNVTLVGAAAIAGLWRRRWPLAFLVAVGLLTIPLTHGLTSRDYSTVTGLYTVVVPIYAVAGWEERGRAIVGLALWSVGATAIGLFEHAALGGLTGPLVAAGATWTVGRVIRSHRELAAQLRESAARLAAERDDRARLAAVAERIRIARDLHGLVAQDVVAMVVQAEAAHDRLDRDADAAREALEAIEATGRRALAQVRLILGVLRTHDDGRVREPQPGLGQIHALVERAREAGQIVELSIEGEPGAVFAGVDLTTYRILEDVLSSAAERRGGAVAIALRFGEESLELDLSAPGLDPRAWPTQAMSDRVKLCNGEVGAVAGDTSGARLVVRLPRAAQGAFA